MPRVFASPGPIYEPEGTPRLLAHGPRHVRRGLSPGELVHNCFSYHFVPAGSMMETGAHALGCTVFPGGTGQTEQQVQAMAELRPAGYIGTPSFLKIILEKAAEWACRCPA
jgi:phenylacetate-CoA ligase